MIQASVCTLTRSLLALPQRIQAALSRLVNEHTLAARTCANSARWLEACVVQLAQRGSAIALGHRPAQPLLAAFSAVFLAAPQLDALAERAPAGLVAGAVFFGGLQSATMQKLLKSFGDRHAPIEAFVVLAMCPRDIAQLVCCCCIVAARHRAKYS